MQRVLVKLIVSEHLFYLLKSVTYVLLHYTTQNPHFPFRTGRFLSFALAEESDRYFLVRRFFSDCELADFSG